MFIKVELNPEVINYVYYNNVYKPLISNTQDAMVLHLSGGP